MIIRICPATQNVSVELSMDNPRIFYEGREHDNYYTGIHPEVMDWLDAHDPNWDMVEVANEAGFAFSSMGHALLFKLTWGGK